MTNTPGFEDSHPSDNDDTPRDFEPNELNDLEQEVSAEELESQLHRDRCDEQKQMYLPIDAAFDLGLVDVEAALVIIRKALARGEPT